MAGGIKRKGGFGGSDIRFAGDTDSDEKIVRYCSNCDTYGFKVKLGSRILRPGENITPDWDYYLQCHECGKMEPKESARVESDISDVVEKDTSIGDYVVPLNDRPTSKRERRMQKFLDKVDLIPDDDIKREVSKGNKVTIVEDSEGNIDIPDYPDDYYI